jgi:hypothetical protein
MLLVSQAANGSLSARRLPSKPPGPSTTNPYPLFANPRRLRRRLALSGSGADQAPRRAAPTPAAAGEGPSASSTEDPVLVRVADEGVPLEGVIQIEKPGDAAAESKLVSYAYEPYPVTRALPIPVASLLRLRSFAGSWVFWPAGTCSAFCCSLRLEGSAMACPSSTPRRSKRPTPLLLVRESEIEPF